MIIDKVRGYVGNEYPLAKKLDEVITVVNTLLTANEALEKRVVALEEDLKSHEKSRVSHI